MLIVFLAGASHGTEWVEEQEVVDEGRGKSVYTIQIRKPPRGATSYVFGGGECAAQKWVAVKQGRYV
jgi:hypothetical protein